MDAGWLVPPGNPVVLADSIDTILSAPETALEKGRFGREKVVKNFNIKQTAREYEALYRKIVSKRDNKCIQYIAQDKP